VQVTRNQWNNKKLLPNVLELVLLESKCVGCIDCLLIWTNRPSPADWELLTGCGPTKFLCGRKKHKFGLNMLAACDPRSRFLDVSIRHPSSTSNHLSFITSPLRHKLEEPGFLTAGLHLMGDNACVNTPCMAMPCPATTGAQKMLATFASHSSKFGSNARLGCFFCDNQFHLAFQCRKQRRL
jgi:hypothetical protein